MPYAAWRAIPARRTPLLPYPTPFGVPWTKEPGMPPTADLLSHRDHTSPTATPARRRRRRSEPHTSADAAAALQRALDRRDNGGVTGH